MTNHGRVYLLFCWCIISEQEGLQTAGVLETGNAGTEEEEEEKEQEGKANQDKLQQPDPGGAGGGSNSIKESGHIFR